MPIRVVCDECDSEVKVKDDLAGKKIRCKGCGATMEVPDAEPVSRRASAGGAAQRRPTPDPAARQRPARPGERPARPAERPMRGRPDPERGGKRQPIADA